ncbi:MULTISPECIES: hypothetical protein [Rhodanobacter]|uniref:hypothetical protein n=1 Tax=Rhodanobacter TaxID=75309 RepID=UPI000A66DF8C|nr:MULTISPECIES: hypothetical protein [Rhodanobacter]UJJ50925.1 hypothetical protein LRK52_17075 [Rhodanobacter denitrificans]UJJ56878.1 hypothetical protein LRK55_09310 [Rhodanobacter denitrificans]UJM93640.1 hypothetical protein LRK32_16980 [Rhodanobacter denitrificans]UJM97171.1 hypothetical protein LRK44_16990 [Rhodanobacter denitrificans]UJN20001.1 hypothetical protein LRK54_09650 [Rhodanobacter denitrificans]
MEPIRKRRSAKTPGAATHRLCINTGAWLLGADARSVLDQPGNERSITTITITSILEPQVDPAGTLRLAAEMDRADPVRALTLLQEFHKGFLGCR